MDELRQALFGISLGTAAAQCQLEKEQHERLKVTLAYLAQAARQAFDQLEEIEAACGEQK